MNDDGPREGGDDAHDSASPGAAAANGPAPVESAASAAAPRVRVGIGGWSFPAWRAAFYPAGLPAAQELAHASRRLATIEINSTFYVTPSAKSWATWRDATPEGFVFAVKAPRAATQRRDLREAAASVERFFASGIAALGDRLGPVCWQLAPFKRFDADELGAWLALLPRALPDGRPLRHALEARHASFASRPCLDLLRARGVALVFADEAGRAAAADLTADFVYTRIMRADETLPEGFDDATRDALAACLATWRDGGEPAGVPKVDAACAPAVPRDVFAYVIRVGKPRAPQAAMALQRAVDAAPRAAG